jgi:hypothetical protein
MLGWKKATKKATPRCVRLFGEAYGPNLADLSSTSSTRIAGLMYEQLGVGLDRKSSVDLAGESDDDGSTTANVDLFSDEVESRIETAMERLAAEPSAGSALERALQLDLMDSLSVLSPDRHWLVTRSGTVNQFSQYAHLSELQRLFVEIPAVRATVGRDYQVSTDVMVGLPNPKGPEHPHVLHAAVSSKLTIRSDRVQNIRYEFGMLVRNRKGRLPHLVVVTAEPLPSRLVSIARGTGEIDAVYHLLFDEMHGVLEHLPRELQMSLGSQRSDWLELVEQDRIRPYSELAATLAVD